MTDHHDPFATARQHVELAINHLRLDATTAAALRSEHEVAVRRDELGGVSYVSPTGELLPGVDTAVWLRSIDRDRPHLVGKAPRTTPPAESPERAPAVSPIRSAPTTTVSVATGSFSALNASAAAGDPAAIAQVQANIHKTFGLPDPTKPNFTQLMTSAKRGNPAALAALKRNLPR